MRRRCKVKVGIDDSWFDDGHLILRPYLDDPVHPLEAEDDAPGDGMSAAGQAGAPAPGYNRHSQPVCAPHHVLDLVHIFSKHDDGGLGRLHERTLVAGVAPPGVPVGQNAGCPHAR